MDFKNKVVLITGASSGIGKQTAIEFARHGSTIILVARRRNKLEEVEQELKKFDVTTLICEDRKSTRLNSSHSQQSRMPSSA